MPKYEKHCFWQQIVILNHLGCNFQYNWFFPPCPARLATVQKWRWLNVPHHRSCDEHETCNWHGFVIRPKQGQCFSIFFLVHNHPLSCTSQALIYMTFSETTMTHSVFARKNMLSSVFLRVSVVTPFFAVWSYLNMICSRAQLLLVPLLGAWLSLVSFLFFFRSNLLC